MTVGLVPGRTSNQKNFTPSIFLGKLNSDECGKVQSATYRRFTVAMKCLAYVHRADSKTHRAACVFNTISPLLILPSDTCNHTSLILQPLLIHTACTRYIDEGYYISTSDCLCVTTMSPAKMAEPIEMPFCRREQIQVGLGTIR